MMNDPNEDLKQMDKVGKINVFNSNKFFSTTYILWDLKIDFRRLLLLSCYKIVSWFA
jgi:hypothetical protein